MERIVKSIEDRYLLPALELVEEGFVEYKDSKEGKMVRKLVEGNPRNYSSRGFLPSYQFGIEAGPAIKLPHPDCQMVKELKKGSLNRMKGLVDYSFYETLSEG